MGKYINIYNVLIGSIQVWILTIKGNDERFRAVTTSNRSRITMKNYPRVYGVSLLVAMDLIIENERD